jgi:hypothetical protein
MNDAIMSSFSPGSHEVGLEYETREISKCRHAPTLPLNSFLDLVTILASWVISLKDFVTIFSEGRGKHFEAFLHRGKRFTFFQIS